MREISEKVMDQFEEAALEGLKAMREAMAHKGNDRRYFEQGRIGQAAANAFVRLRASESNRMQVEIVAKRLDEILSGDREALPRPRSKGRSLVASSSK
jgi:hypothetical protein